MKQDAYCPNVRQVDVTEIINRKVHPIVHVSQAKLIYLHESY